MGTWEAKNGENALYVFYINWQRSGHATGWCLEKSDLTLVEICEEREHRHSRISSKSIAKGGPIEIHIPSNCILGPKANVLPNGRWGG